MPAKLAPVEAKTLPKFEPVVGTVRPRLEATVSARISGRILDLPVVSGQKVEADQLIARIDAEELQAARSRAQAALEQAKRELTRQENLLKSRATTRALFDQAEGAERMARASLEEIESTLANALVRAPFAGTVTHKFANTGDLAVPGRALVQLEDPSSLRLEAPVAESLSGALSLGQNIHVQVEAAALAVEGEISEMAPSADSASRTFLVKIDLPSAPGLRAGLFGRARIPRGEAPVLLTPASSILHRGQMEVAFVALDGKAHLRLVRTVPHDENFRAVLAGLTEGDQVVLHPPASLRDGSPLKTD